MLPCTVQSPQLDNACSQINMLLRERHTGNVLAVKLIDHENLMDESDDDYDVPNIDVNHVALGGRLIQLPAGVNLKSQ